MPMLRNTLENDDLEQIVLCLESEQNLKNPSAIRTLFDYNIAIVLCFDQHGSSSSSGSRVYKARFIENGRWLVDNEGNIINVTLGNLLIQPLKEILPKTPENLQIMQ